MFKIVILTAVPELTQNEFDTLICLVSLEKRERIKRLHFFHDAQQSLLGDVLTRVEICHSTKFGMEQLVFTTNIYGKPFLVNNPNFHFNMSHAGYYVACAIADEPVGIDIELIKPIEQEIAERFFAPDEKEYIFAGDYTPRFYEVWTKKESRIKLEGKGLYTPLTSFSVFESEKREQIIYHEVYRNDEAICHVCSTKQELPEVRMMDTSSFMRSVRLLLGKSSTIFF